MPTGLPTFGLTGPQHLKKKCTYLMMNSFCFNSVNE